MKPFDRRKILAGIFLTAIIILYGFSGNNKDAGQLHVLRLKNPQKLMDLLHYTGDPLLPVSGHRGGTLLK